MHTTHLSSGIAALALALLLVAWVFDGLLLLVLASALLLFLLARFVLFFTDLRVAGDHLVVHRKIDKTIIRQGGLVTVTTTCSVQAPRRARVAVQEHIPVGAVLKRGETQGPCPGAITLQYEITMMATGAIRFGGIDLRVEDAFFRTTIRCRTTIFRAPVIHVEPFNVFALIETTGLQGESEQEKRRLLPGFGIRSFREYVMGDDPRHIDWKLSAKHDRIFVREYTSISGDLPLVVLDIPGRDAPQGVVDSLKGAVAGLVEKSAGHQGGGHLLVITGANVIRSLSFGRQMREVRELLTTIIPGERLVSLYRRPDPATLRSRSRRAAAVYPADPREQPFLSELSAVYSSNSSAMKPSTFEVQLSRVMLPLPSSDLYLFSPFTGDQSHIRMLVLTARKAGMRVHARAPAAIATPELLRVIAHLDMASIGVV